MERGEEAELMQGSVEGARQSWVLDEEGAQVVERGSLGLGELRERARVG